MKWHFKYNENKPSYDEYNKLLEKINEKSKLFFALNNIFKNPYNYDDLVKYDKAKKKIVYEMFNDIIKCFSNIENIPCAIYLNGSYGRGSITAKSDLDITIYFKKEDITKYQTLVYLIRYAMSKMINQNIVHVHSFTKNFTTKYRKENNLVVSDEELETTIEWNGTKEKLIINYPSNQMIPEREICEITSLKCMEDLETLIKNKLIKSKPKEWMYTHECIYKSDDSFDVNNLIRKLDSIYDEEMIKEKLMLLKEEIFEIKNSIKDYFYSLNNNERIVLSDFNMYGKRRVFLLINTILIYLRWYYILNKRDVSETLNVIDMLNDNNDLINEDLLKNLKNNFYYYKYIISRLEIWTMEYKHYFSHRSREVINKEQLYNEYYHLWNNNYNPIDEQMRIFNRFDIIIDDILNECEKTFKPFVNTKKR